MIGEENSKIIENAGKFDALGSSLFGDETSYYNGATEFSATDVSLSGNSKLFVGVTRRYTIEDRKDVQPDGAFGDWDIDLPHIEGTFANPQATPTGHWNFAPSRCRVPTLGSPGSQPPSVTLGAGGPNPHIFTARQFWHGYKLHLPGQGEQELLIVDQNQGASQRPAQGGPYYWGTKEQIYVSCSDTAQGSEVGEGFVVVSPDGTRYYLNHFMARNAAPLRSPASGKYNGHTLVRQRVFAYPTRAEDRFGNSVTYTWSNGLLASITDTSAGGDVRNITFTYSGGTPTQRPTIATVNDGTRQWQYSYGTTPFGRRSLTGIALPDASSWSINFATFTDLALAYEAEPQVRDCMQPGDVFFQGTQTPVGTMRHPSGAEGRFEMGITRHWRSNIPAPNGHGTQGNCVSTDPNTDDDDYAIIPYSSDAISMIRKTISGSGVPTHSWDLGYPDASDQPVYSPTVRTVVQSPDGTYEQYVHTNRVGIDEGKLLRKLTGSSETNILSEHTFAYAQFPPNGAGYNHRVGVSPQQRGHDAVRKALNSFVAEHMVPTTAKTVTQQGVAFQWLAVNFDNFANVTKQTRASARGSKTEDLTYLNDTARWVIGLPTSMATNGVTESTTTYHPVSLLPHVETSFGRTVKTSFWNGDGTLASVADGAGKTTGFSDYYRGIPRLVRYPDQTTESTVVNNIGRITTLTDEMGFATNYGYDSIGRLSSVSYPAGDVVAWSPTSIVYAQVASAEYGIPGSSYAPHWRRTKTTSNEKEITYFDALWRPILDERFDALNPSGTRSLVRRSFDADGKATLVSYPVASASLYTNILTGTRSTFDTLDRPTGTSADSELGPLETRIDYLPTFQRSITNPRLKVTTESFQAFDSPSMDAPVSRAEPLGISVTIARDAWSKPTAITRAGSWTGGSQSQTRSFIYDAHQRLCKRIDAESGATFFDYDAADNLAWSASGQPYTSLSCDRHNVGSLERVTNTYDTRNRVTNVSMLDPLPGATPRFSLDASYTYFNDGQLKTASTSGSTWTYAYNMRRLLESETLTLNLGAAGTRILPVDWVYNANGDVKSLVYPDGLSVDYAPDALGRPTRAGTLATGVTYHPNGAMSAFTYGNSIVHRMTLNQRQLPLRSWDEYAGSRYVDYTIGYDANGNVKSLVDGANHQVNDTPLGIETRTFGYDARDRLVSSVPTSQTHSYGTETYAYDALDNLRNLHYPQHNILYTYRHDGIERLESIADNQGNVIGEYDYDPRGNVSARGRIHDRSPVDGNSTSSTTSTPVVYAHLFDRRNRLARTLRNNGTSEHTFYDAHGHRTASDRNGAYNVQVYSRAGELLYEEDARAAIYPDPPHPLVTNGKAVRHVRLNGSLVARDMRPLAGGVTSVAYAHTSPIRTATLETTFARQAMHYKQLLSPWGASYNSTGYHDRPGFTGHATDSFSQLTYMQQRYYDPIAGRFLSVDPVGVGSDGDNFNRYWYANNNPYTFTDPDGRRSVVENGSIKIRPEDKSVPGVNLPNNVGAKGVSRSDRSFHAYNVKTKSSLSGAQAGAGFKNNPTPGNDKAASPTGSKNDVGPIPTTDGTNMVRSYSITSPNPAKFTDITVNYTVAGEHGLSEGFVIRFGEIGTDGSTTLRSYGEGNNWRQNPALENLHGYGWGSQVESVWQQNHGEIIGGAR